MERFNRQLLLSFTVSAALGLAALPALAEPPDLSTTGGNEQGQEHSAEGQAQAAQHQAQSNAGGSENGQEHSAEGQAQAAQHQAESAAGQHDAGSQPGGGSGKAGGTEGQPEKTGGPPGNNGTIKVDGVEFDTHPNNEPHVDCRFQIDFYGFDKGDLYATVHFALQPPTTDGSLQVSGGSTKVFIGEDDNSGGGSVAGLDAQETYTLSFPGVTPHPQQGYHVKLTIHADGSQGADTKHKVFWVEPCGGGGATTTSTTSTTTIPPTTTTTVAPTTTTTVAPTTTTTVAPTTTTSTSTTTTTLPGGTPTGSVSGLAVVENTTIPVRVLGEVVERRKAVDVTPARQVAALPAAAGVNEAGTAVLGTAVERAALARTGLNAMQLATLGALAVLAGIAAVRASRRKDQPQQQPRFMI